MKPCLVLLVGFLAPIGMTMGQDAPEAAAELTEKAIVDPVPWWRTGAVQARWDNAEGLETWAG